MRTGPTSEMTREIIVDLEKEGKKSGKAVWLKISERLSASSRRRAQVNVYSLSELAKKNPGKILVVPGKVLSKGNAEGKIEVACFACSEKARKAMEGAKGKVMTLKELIAPKTAPGKMVIVICL